MPPRLYSLHNTMLLQDLPSEVLLNILDCLGRQYFRKDTARLSLSKKWYALARKVLLRNLSVTSFDSVCRLGTYIETLDGAHIVSAEIAFSGYHHGILVLSSPPNNVRFSPQCLVFQASLRRLAAKLRETPSVSTLILKARPQPFKFVFKDRVSPDTVHQNGNFLSAEPFVDLLSLQHLTHLTFDTKGMSFRREATSVHFCKVIHSLFRSLRSLRCRMNWICPRLLDWREDAPLAIEDVRINLSLPRLEHSARPERDHERTLMLQRSESCDLQWTNKSLFSAMIQQANNFAKQMQKSHHFWVMTHAFEFPSERIAWDAILQKEVKLSSEGTWTTCGQIV